MKPRDEYKKLWRDTFDDDNEFIEMFFSRAYSDDDLLYIPGDRAGEIDSALLLQPYTMRFHGSEAGMSYICGAATRRSRRGKGLMGRLLREALLTSYERGDTFCSLIPANSALYFYYSRFGFEPVFLVHDDRYTSLHQFTPEDEYTTVDNLLDESVYDAFSRLEATEPCRVLHSRRDYLNIIDDNRIAGGAVSAVRDSFGEIVAMAFATADGDTVRIADLLGVTADAKVAALQQIRASFPGKSFRVPVMPVEENLESRRQLTPTGMCRIVNVGKCLEMIASANRKLRLTIRVDDPMLPDNSHTFRIDRGKVEINDAFEGNPDLDVNIGILTRIIFSSPEVGNVMGLPAERPRMALMLD